MFDAYGLATLFFELTKEFGYTMFDVISYFVTSITLAKIASHIVEILLKQCASILVYGIKCAVKIDGDILFHCY